MRTIVCLKKSKVTPPILELKCYRQVLSLRERHPIVPIMINDDKTASAMAEYMCHNGIYVVSFSYPVVPQGAARIREQIAAHHTTAQLDKAIAVFISAGKKFGLL